MNSMIKMKFVEPSEFRSFYSKKVKHFYKTLGDYCVRNWGLQMPGDNLFAIVKVDPDFLNTVDDNIEVVQSSYFGKSTRQDISDRLGRLPSDTILVVTYRGVPEYALIPTFDVGDKYEAEDSSPTEEDSFGTPANPAVVSIIAEAIEKINFHSWGDHHHSHVWFDLLNPYARTGTITLKIKPNEIESRRLGWKVTYNNRVKKLDICFNSVGDKLKSLTINNDTLTSDNHNGFNKYLLAEAIADYLF